MRQTEQSNKIKISKFIKLCKKLYGDKYSYDKIKKYSSCEKMPITCPVHGDFGVYVSNFLRGSGCIKCKKNIPKDAKPEPAKLPRKKRRSKEAVSKSKRYFDQYTEDTIVKYNLSTNQDERELLYNTIIYPAFNKLVECIFNTFKFSYFEVGPLDIQKDCVSHLTANIHKFESGKGKAFSYFSIIAKNHLIALNNSTYNRFNKHVEISENRNDSEDSDHKTVVLEGITDGYHKHAEQSEYIRLFLQWWATNVGKIFMKDKPRSIANAILELFHNSNMLDAQNKKALYICIREICHCKTQEISKVALVMAKFTQKIRQEYLNTGTIKMEFI